MKVGVKGRGPIHFRDEIRRALIFYTVIPVAVVVLAFFAFFIFYAHSSIMEVNQENNRLVCGELEHMVDSYGEELIRMWDPDSMDGLRGNASRLRQLQAEATRFIDSMHSQADFYILDEAFGVCVSTADQRPGFMPPDAGLNWGIVRRMTSRPGEPVFEFTSESTKRENQKALVIGAQLDSAAGERYYLFFMVPARYLVDTTCNRPVQVVVTNRYHDVCTSNTNSFTMEFGAVRPEIRRNSAFLSLDDEWYYQHGADILGGEISVYTFTPVKSAMTLFAVDISIFLLVILLIGNISVFGASRVARSKTAVIDQIIRAFEKVKEGNLNTPLNISAEDELSVIGDSYNLMLESLKEQIERNNQVVRETVYSEIRQLESQFNPHFLFNTLETIKFTVKLEPDIASRMIVALSAILRYSINSQMTDVTLEEDLSYIESYLTIQKYRFEDSLFTDIQVDERALDCVVPKLIFQPVIENAIKYGFGETELLTIRIRVTAEDCLLIRVQDDGDGMTEEKLEELRALMKEENRTGKAHFGLYNIDRRIKLMYGGEFGLDIDSRPGSGTSVSMRLPVRHKGEEKHDQGSDCGG
ncbi:MAG: sensor histidine kinase [Enterocloster asparagiformis]|nr:sensor histidine kinase [Enterocloster asparagiformis]